MVDIRKNPVNALDLTSMPLLPQEQDWTEEDDEMFYIKLHTS